MLDLSTKRSRKLSTWQAYSKLYYESKIKDQVQEKWQAKYLSDHPGHDLNSIPPPPLKFRNEVTKWLYNLEPIDVKNEVEVERNREVIEIVDDDDEDDVGVEESGRKKIAKDYQMYVHTFAFC